MKAITNNMCILIGDNKVNMTTDERMYSKRSPKPIELVEMNLK